MDAQKLIHQRAQKDMFFKNHAQSPLTPQQKQYFTGLSYYPFNPRLELRMIVREFAQKQDIQIQTTAGQTKWYRRYGEFEFTVGKQNARLTIYQTPNGFFLPVVDVLAGQETYPAGRYMEPVQVDRDKFIVDLNQLYNPFCAYGDGWNCPITPVENRLNVPIRAGEKIPQGAWVK